MMERLILTCAFILLMLLGGIAVDRLYLRFKRSNPELGPFRDKKSGCSCCATKDSCSGRSGCG